MESLHQGLELISVWGRITGETYNTISYAFGVQKICRYHILLGGKGASNYIKILSKTCHL